VKFQDKVFSKFQDNCRPFKVPKGRKSLCFMYQKSVTVFTKGIPKLNFDIKQFSNDIFFWLKQVVKIMPKYRVKSFTLNCHWAWTTAVNIRTFVLND